ncbi:MAG: hypothetical protein JWR19_839 [Pedosphaera sp.]|nr:hypothetical protein [Pedosphaera sp.]
MKNSHANYQSGKVVVYTVIALWFLFALLMGIFGQYVSGPEKPPLYLGLTLGLPMLFFVAAYVRRGALWAFAQTLDLRVITLLHIWRLLGVVFLIDYFQGRLPGGFALPAGIGDVITAVTAVPLALAMSHQTPGVRKWFVAWNIFGLVDLIVAVGSGILHSASSFGILAGAGPTTLLMSQFPLSMVPTFFVPLFILLHLLALARGLPYMSMGKDEDDDGRGLHRMETGWKQDGNRMGREVKRIVRFYNPYYGV